MSKYVIIDDAQGLGRLCNRLGIYAHFIAFGLSTGRKVLNLSFHPYSRHFKSLTQGLVTTEQANGLRIPANRVTRGFSRGVLCTLEKVGVASSIEGHLGPGELRPDDEINIDEEAFILAHQSNRIIRFCGWRFRAFQHLSQHASSIRHILAFNDQISAEASKLIKAHRNKPLLAVHIRHGDYTLHLGGQYYFPAGEYLRAADDIIKKFGDHKLLVFSDDEIDDTTFAGRDATVIRRNDVIELAVMSGCDRIVGPPSSFNQWASFLGAVPLHSMNTNSRAQVADSYRTAWPLDFGQRPLFAS